ncbi:MAG: cytochrome c [Deltaproteobacteria bacterium]|nr:cytochrome c [Deltaproteobacteria bacterium]
MRNRNKTAMVIGIAVVAAALGLVAPDLARTASQQTEWNALKNGRDIYMTACAACHGGNGRGNSQSSVAFETPLPDFSDCNFTSREGAADWFQIARLGGPVRGFHQMMPAFGEALTDAQLKAAVAHIKRFCAEDKWPDGILNLPKALVTGKAYPEDEYMFTYSMNGGSPWMFEGKFVFEKRIGARHQVEVAIPVVVKELERQKADGTTQTRFGEGVGDIALGYKFNVFHSLKSLTIMSLSTEVILPSGDEADRIGKGFFRIEPFLTLGQLIPALGFLQFQAGAELSTKPNKGAHELFWRGVFGHSFAKGGYGRTWSPMIEVLGAKEMEDDTKIEWQVLPELQVTLNQRQHIRFCLGARIPVTDFDRDNIQYMAYLLWDWFDGGFTDGWRGAL